MGMAAFIFKLSMQGRGSKTLWYQDKSGNSGGLFKSQTAMVDCLNNVLVGTHIQF